MNFRSWQRWQLIEYALLQKISEEKAVENGKALPQTKQENHQGFQRILFCLLPCYFTEIPLALTSFIPALL